MTMRKVIVSARAVRVDQYMPNRKKGTHALLCQMCPRRVREGWRSRRACPNPAEGSRPSYRAVSDQCGAVRAVNGSTMAVVNAWKRSCWTMTRFSLPQSSFSRRLLSAGWHQFIRHSIAYLTLPLSCDDRRQRPRGPPHQGQ
jgi:hypothetical protein